MRYRKLGNTGLNVSEIGLGGEWLERHDTDEVKRVIDRCEEMGINILDCWMSNPKVRSDIGAALVGRRERWMIQGHIGSTWQNDQYVRTRSLAQAKAAFDDLLKCMRTDYIDLGMIHYVDNNAEYEQAFNGEFYEYVKSLRAAGTIRHIGMSTHNPTMAKRAVLDGKIEMLLFSVNPAFDLMPSTENLDDFFEDKYDEGLSGIAPEREELYKLCEQRGIGMTVMKGYAGGRLFSKETSPFGVELTPVQCLHYALTRPSVASVMVGFDTPEHVDAAVAYETATDAEKDYATVLAKAPKHAYFGQCTYCGHCAPCPKRIDIAMTNKLYDLAVMQPEVPQSIRAHYEAMTANASDCINCGGCETRCPFGVKIRERMALAGKLFG